MVVDESTLSGIQYLNILVGCLETPHASYCRNVNFYHVRHLVTAFLKQLTMLLDLLESTGILPTFCCLMLQNTVYGSWRYNTKISVSKAVSCDIGSTFIVQSCYQSQISL